MSRVTRSKVRGLALILAKENRQSEPGITRILWFPDDREVRLVGVEDGLPASSGEQVEPFYFGASPADLFPLPSGIALIRPDEVGRLRLPDGWGDWADAEELELGALEVSE